MALPTLTFVCGFDEGGYTDGPNPGGGFGGAHQYTDAGAAAGVSFIAGGRSGQGYGMRCLNGATVKANGWASGKIRVGSGWIKPDVTAAGSNVFLRLDDPSSAHTCFGFNNTTGRIYAEAGGGQVNGPNLTLGVYHRITWYLDTTNNPTVLKWTVDGVAQTDATWATATWTPGPYSWVGGGGACDWTVDDFVFSQTAADYPMGPYTVRCGLMIADGTHAVGAGTFTDELGTAITNGTTNGYLKVDQMPDVGTWIRQGANATGAYVEWKPTQQTSKDRIDGVWFAGLVSKDSIIGGSQVVLKAVIDGAESTFVSADPAGQGAGGGPTVLGAYYATRPNGQRWNVATLNAMRLRFGYSGDVSPKPYVHGLYYEAAFADNTYDGPIGNVAPNPRLLIEYFTNDPSTFGPLKLDGVITDAVNVGWSWYSRRPAKAFFTLRQNSIHNVRLLPLKHHIKIWFLNETAGAATTPTLVFSGRLNEPDSSGQDVVWSVWNYLADLSLSRTGYRTLYPQKLLGTEIASPEWTAARTAVFSILNHVVTGTIENPLDSGGVNPIKTDTRFGVIDVPRLLLMFDLSEIGRANTVNNVVFEITREPPYTFNFWKNKGSPNPLSGYRLAFPGNIRDYRHVPGYASLRNDLATIGSTVAGGATEVVKTDEVNAAEWGRRQDVFTIKTLAGQAGAATELDAQQAITARAVKEATVLSKDLMVDLAENLPTPNGSDDLDMFEPFRLSSAAWDLEDTIRVQIKRGKDNIDAAYRIVGIRGLQNAQGYHGQLFLTLPTT